MRFARACASCARAEASDALARSTAAVACSGSIWSRNWPRATTCPSRTASRTIRPLTSALRSTFVCGRICPLAVTEATRSRRCTGSIRTSTPLLLRFVIGAWIGYPRAGGWAHDERRRVLTEGTTHRILECREGAVIFVDGIDAVDLRLL